MVILHDLPNEILHQIALACEPKSYQSLCLVSRRLKDITQPRIWENVTIEDGNWRLEKFLTALDSNPQLGELVRSFQFHWKLDFWLYKSGDVVKEFMEFPLPVLKLMPNLYLLRISRPPRDDYWKDRGWPKALSCVTGLQELGLDGFVHTPETIKALSTFEELRHITVRCGLVPRDWMFSCSDVGRNSVTWLTLEAIRWPKEVPAFGTRRAMYTKFADFPCTILLDVLSVFHALKRLDLRVGPTDLGNGMLILVLDRIPEYHKLSSFNLRITAPSAKDVCFYPDFSSWQYLEELTIDSEALWPSKKTPSSPNDGWDKRCSLRNKLPNSLRYLKINFPYLFGTVYRGYSTNVNGIVQVSSDDIRVGGEDNIPSYRYAWLSNLAHAIGPGKPLPALQKVEFVEEACYGRYWTGRSMSSWEGPLRHTSVKLPHEIQALFEDQGVEVIMKARAHKNSAAEILL